MKPGDIFTEQGRQRLQVHGGMSVTVGGGSGTSFYGTSAWVNYYDPATGLGLGFSFSNYHGDGLYNGYYPGSYYPASYAPEPRLQLYQPAVLFPDGAPGSFGRYDRMEATTIPARVFRGDGATLRGRDWNGQR